MLQEIYIKNFALIEELRIKFENGLNIITGETGSGKSILIDALSMALGKKGDKSYVRRGCDKAIIEVSFQGAKEELLQRLYEIGIDDCEEEIIISREINADGKTVGRINSRSVSKSILKEISSQLITIHGQNEYEQLLTSQNQLKLLDLFGSDEVESKLSSYTEPFNKLNDLRNEILKLANLGSPSQMQREIDLIKYEIQEIKEAKLRPEEKQELTQELKRAENVEKIQSILENNYEVLYTDSQSILDNLSASFNKFDTIEDYDQDIKLWNEVLKDCYYRLEDVANDIRSKKGNFEYDANLIDELNYRLDIINTLFRKYGNSYDKTMEFLKDSEKRLEELTLRDELIEKIKKEIITLEIELEDIALELTFSRKNTSAVLKEKILKELHSLKMNNTQFDIEFNKTDYTSTGMDAIEFLVNFNKGEGLKPLNKIASGGEISRFMLAFKNVISEMDNIETLIFDEIDTGVSGIAAQMIGDKLKDISKHRQVLCITHLPQIASCADNHYLVEKYDSEESTHTKINILDADGRIQEIAKMIGGLHITNTTLESARELIGKNTGR